MTLCYRLDCQSDFLAKSHFGNHFYLIFVKRNTENNERVIGK